jgi:hypothetical protein
MASLDVMSSDAARKAIAAMPDREKTALLVRWFEDDPQVAAELRATVRKGLDLKIGTSPTAPCTVGELRIRANAIRLACERAEEEEVAEERRRQADAAAKAHQTRLETIRRRGESIWREVDHEIERRNSASYDKAAAVLSARHSVEHWRMGYLRFEAE